MKRCDNCGSKARYRIRNAHTRAANGRHVCESAICWGFATGGYPAEGVPLEPTKEVAA